MRRAPVFTPVAVLSLGLVLASAVARLLSSFFLGGSPFDPVTFVGAPPVLVSLSLAACFVPARREARVDPMVAL